MRYLQCRTLTTDWHYWQHKASTKNKRLPYTHPRYGLDNALNFCSNSSPTYCARLRKWRIITHPHSPCCWSNWILRLPTHYNKCEVNKEFVLLLPSPCCHAHYSWTKVLSEKSLRACNIHSYGCQSSMEHNAQMHPLTGTLNRIAFCFWDLIFCICQSFWELK